MSDTSGANASSARAVKQITLLMPVWGYRYIDQFLEFCLSSLLAPNNIPALAQALPCRFILLSSAVDEGIFQSHPAWLELEQLCDVEILPIDDLITHGNHSATLTLAFERAIRRPGNAIRDTCFIFLMSDYFFADGSLKTVITAIQGGASCCLAGNFQIIAEDAAPILQHRIDSTSHEIVWSPRDLVRWSLAHLHPATAANIVNFGSIHNAHTNRLFWRVDEDTLIGRFYLMHPIAIHPEVPEFVVGSSWDYSFVPELCPSGNIAVLADSDEYFVIELQRRKYESENLRPGPIDPKILGASLSEWATENHRRNVEKTLVFHAADRPPNLPEVITQADAFVESVRQFILAQAPHHRQHPYWIGSIAVNRLRCGRPLGKPDWSFLLAEKASEQTFLQRVQAKFFGSPLELTRLHPLWPDYEIPLKAFNDASSANGRILLVAPEPEEFAQWVVRAAGDVVTLSVNHLLQSTRVPNAQTAETFDTCLLFLSEELLEQSDELIEHVTHLMKAKGQIIVTVANSKATDDATEFGRIFLSVVGRLVNLSTWIEGIQYIELSPRRMAIRKLSMRLASMAHRQPFLAPAVGPFALATFFANLATRTSSNPTLGAWSSVCLKLRVSEQAFHNSPPFAREATLNRDGLAFQGQARRHAVDVQEQLVLSTMDMHENDEPATLASTFACYRFVAALMGHRHDVAEYGCASPFGTQHLLQHFKRITLFDPRPLLIGDISQRLRDNTRFQAQVHDILDAPLSRPVDSIYCIDFIQYMSRNEEDTFVRNLHASLTRDFDFILIGSPSYSGEGERVEKPAAAQNHTGTNTQTDTADQMIQQELRRRPTPRQPEFSNKSMQVGSLGALKYGIPVDNRRIYRRTARELNALLERFFHTVFIFSKIDDTFRPGIHLNAPHIFALACGKKH